MLLQRVEEWGIRGLENLARRFGRGTAMPRHLQTGLEGEREALFYLRRHGYTVVARRWTSARARGDLDLIAWHRGTLCFVEIKTRTARDAVAAETAVDRSKRKNLRLLARLYLNGFAEPARSQIATRFDILSIYLPGPGAEFEMLEQAFSWSEPRPRGW